MDSLDRLPRRERQVLDTLFALGEASAEQVRAALSDPPGNSAIRAMLARIEAKGFVRHRVIEQRYLYTAAVPKQKAGQLALRQLVGAFFNGSAAGAATALLGMTESVDADELRQLEAMVEAVRRRSQ